MGQQVPKVVVFLLLASPAFGRSCYYYNCTEKGDSRCNVGEENKIECPNITGNDTCGSKPNEKGDNCAYYCYKMLLKVTGYVQIDLDPRYLNRSAKDTDYEDEKGKQTSKEKTEDDLTRHIHGCAKGLKANEAQFLKCRTSGDQSGMVLAKTCMCNTDNCNPAKAQTTPSARTLSLALLLSFLLLHTLFPRD